MTIIITDLLFFSRWYPYRLTWRDTASIWRYQCRQADLERLVRWATRKRLAGPRTHYQTLLVDTEQRLLQCQLRHPRLAWWLRFIFGLITQVFAPRYHYQKGAAAKYRMRNYSLNWRGLEKVVLLK